MAEFESGIKGYVHAVGKVEMFFPVDHSGRSYVNCDMCRFFSATRHSCRLTDEIILNPTKYVGDKCPLIPVDD